MGLWENPAWAISSGTGSVLSAKGSHFCPHFWPRGRIFALLIVYFCLRGRIFDAISGEGVRFPEPL